ncbi:MAG: hypothetical protein R3C32_11980 [Chloroflexota bacterium]
MGEGSDTYDVSDLVLEPRDAASIPETSLFHPPTGSTRSTPRRRAAGPMPW